MKFFPCFHCDKGSKGIPARCSNFINCADWCEWARENNRLDEEDEEAEADETS